MNVTLRPELEKYIEEQLRAGRFDSADELLEAGIARLMLDPPVDALDADDLRAIEESEAQIERGEVLDWNQVSNELRRKYLGE